MMAEPPPFFSMDRKKRTTKACDICCEKVLVINKRRKCSGDQPCEYCVLKELKCTYLNPTRKRGPHSKAEKKKSVRKKEEEKKPPEIHPDNESSGSQTSVFSAQDSIKYTLQVPLKPPKLSMEMIPLSQITSTLDRWNHDAFPPIQTEKDKTAPWLDVYFMWNHPKVPVLSPKWVYENYHDLPLFLVHAMYALALTFPVDGEINYGAGDYHYACCKVLYEDSLVDPNPFTILATYLMGLYALSSTDALQAGISNVSMAIRMGQQLKLGHIEQLTWLSPKGRILGSDEGSGKIMWRLLWYSMYQNDYYYAFIQKIPFLMIEEPLDLPRIENTPGNEVEVFSSFYTSGLWSYFYDLLTIARRITNFVWKEVANVDETDWNKEKNLLIKSLDSWFEATPSWFQKSTESYSYEIVSTTPPPWITAHMKIFYFHLYMLIHRSLFMFLIENNPDSAYTHLGFQETLKYAFEITKITKQFLDQNRKFIQACPYLFFGVHLSASSLCMAIPSTGRNPDVMTAISVLIESMELFSCTMPVMQVRANMIKEWAQDPVRFTPIYGHII